MKRVIVLLALAVGMSWMAPAAAQQFNLVGVKTIVTKPEPLVMVFKKGEGCGIKGHMSQAKLAPRWSSAVFVGLWKECGLAGFAFGATDLWFRIDDVQVSDPGAWMSFVTSQGPQLTCARQELIGRAGNPTVNIAVSRGFCN